MDIGVGHIESILKICDVCIYIEKWLRLVIPDVKSTVR